MKSSNGFFYRKKERYLRNLRHRIVRNTAWAAILASLFLGNIAHSALEGLTQTGKPLSADPAGGMVTIQGQIVNGSNGQGATVEELILYTMGDTGLEVLEKQTNAGTHFRFQSIPVPSSALLITAVYQGEEFFRMLHPGDANFTNPQRIFVFNRGASGREVRLTSMTLFTKLKEGLRVERLYVVTNGSSPPRIMDTQNLRLKLPEGASNVSSYMRLEETNLSLPVKLSKTQGGYKMDRSFRPGSNTLSVSFDIPGHTFTDFMPDIVSVKENEGTISHNFRVISWKPEGARPVIEGAQTQDIEVPEFERAMQVVYQKNKDVTYDFTAGSYVIDRLVEEHSLPFFSNGWVALLAAILLAVAAFIVGGFVKKENTMA